ncbi:patatin [Hylemonella gracilis]|uniref:Patatin n=1 Tax=Hylemonella gracilis TaxID=80880 RepID=A0A4P6UGW3_9BURK|nr:CBASS cGAMP-activated phospholipase [Hylemonella gracilis]QBK04498.1 patatin [Hylemonella gracilis]
MWTNETPFQALSLTGGGYRGLFTARSLQVIEEHVGVPIGQRFDLTCGTSIGGIVALAVAFEVPMKQVVEVFEQYGAAIFPPHDPPSTKVGKGWDLWQHARKPRYSTAPLREAISKLLDKDATLNDAKHAVAIPAVNVTQGKPQVFKTRHKEEWARDWKFKAVDVALATAAAPTFFELAELGGNLYADGGLFANAPDLLALHEAEYFFNVPTDAVRILSIGTTTKSYSVSFASGRQFGIADWMEDQRLFSVTISAQQQFVDQLIQHKLQDRYFRLDHEPSQEQTKDLGLDVATEAARMTLKALADKATTDVLSNRLKDYLVHQPQLKLAKEN